MCHYCTFAHAPREGEPHYLSPEAVLDIARRGQAAGCKEALFTLGDQPELRYTAARDALRALGAETTLDYLERSAALVLKETGLLPHLNPGVMDEAWLARLRKVSVSQGIMLETASERLSRRGGPHFGSPDKLPAVRLATLEAAGRARVPFTTGILIGIGETRAERIEALLAIRDVHERHGHIQEVIVQNFRAKPGTRMSGAPEPTLEDHAWTIAVARLVLGPAMNIQAPPNLQPDGLAQLVRAGINDWGGVSPVTPDHVNPEAPWPHLADLERATALAGRTLVERLAIYPEFTPSSRNFASAKYPGPRIASAAHVAGPGSPRWRAPAGMTRWVDAALVTPTLRHMDGAGLAREDGWAPGGLEALPAVQMALLRGQTPRFSGRSAIATDEARGLTAFPSPTVARVLARVANGVRLDEADIVALFDARGADFAAVCRAANELRAQRVGDTVTYIVNRNINYTNVCTYGCKFCAFSKGRHNLGHRDKPYDLDMAEISARTAEAWERGATEVCLQGGIKPSYTGDTYLSVVEAVKSAAPDMHVHAFSPLEIRTGADTLGLSLHDYLSRLQGCWPRQPAGHGGGDPGRRGARHPVPGQDQHRRVVRGDGDGARGGPAQHRHHHVRPRRRLPALGAPPPARARAAGEDRRLHRVRAAAVRAHGGADLPQGAVAQGADVPRGRAHARGGAAGARSGVLQHPGVVGEDGPGRARRCCSMPAATTSAAC